MVEIRGSNRLRYNLDCYKFNKHKGDGSLATQVYDFRNAHGHAFRSYWSIWSSYA